MITEDEKITDDPTIRPLSEMIGDMVQHIENGEKSVGDILEEFHERGFGFLLLLFAAPMALPIPVPPGLNVILASPLILLTAQQALGRHTIWVPERTKRKKFSGQSLKKTFLRIIPWVRKIELLIKPRLGFITYDGPSRLIGFLGLMMALTICIPVPLTNTVPSFGIALMAIGVSMRDGLAVLCGAFIGTLWITILGVAVAIFGNEAFEIIKNAIKSIL